MTHDEARQLERLLERMFDDQLSAAELADLERILLEDPEARAQYRSMVRMNALLAARLEGPDAVALPAGLTAELGAEEIVAEEGEPSHKSQPAEKGVKRKKKQKSNPLMLGYWKERPLRFSALALALTLLLWAGFYFLVLPGLRGRQHAPEHQQSFIARISDSQGAEWAGTPLAEGAVLETGQTLELNYGFVEVTFGNGAVVLLEGPSKLEIDSRRAGTLENGRLVARIEQREESGVDFSISTPLAQIIDLGTEFGVEAAHDGTTTIEVLEGKVEATRRGGDPRLPPATLRLGKGQTARIRPNQPGFEQDVDSGVGFIAQMPEEVDYSRIITPVSVISSLEEATDGDRPSRHLIVGDPWLLRRGPVERWTYLRGERSGIWGVPGKQLPCTLTFDLGAVYELSQLWIWNFSADEELYYTNNSAKSVRVEGSEDGEDYIWLADIELQPTNNVRAQAQSFSLSARARYVRLEVIDGHHDETLLGSAENATIGMSQVRFEGAPVAQVNAAEETP